MRQFPVSWMCQKLRVSRSGFYKWRQRKRRAVKNDASLLATHIKAVHAASRGVYGSPRIHRALRQQGIRINRKRVERIMREYGLQGRTSRKFVKTTVCDGAREPSPNILQRKFTTERPNQVWVTDITFIQTTDGWLYLAAVIDLFSGRVVGHALADHMRTELVLDALHAAISVRRIAPGLIHHADRGSQYTSHAYQAVLTAHQMISSMSRKAQCWDNSPAESFFGRLKEELIYARTWWSADHVRRAIDDYINVFYNTKRIRKKLGYRSPAEYELDYAARLSAA